MADPAADIRRLEQLKSIRLEHERVWKDCFDYTYPLRGSGFNGQILNAQQGQECQANLVVDVTGVDAVRILTSGVVGGTTPSNSLWFGLGVQDADTEGVEWLDASAQNLFDNIHGANFDAVAFESNLDGVIAGWFVMYIDEDETEGGFVFDQWPLAQCWIAASKQGGKIDTIYREFELTVEQIVNTYGRENVSESVGKSYDSQKFDQKFKIVHAIYPRTNYVVNARLSKNLPFASCHYEIDSKKELKESGYHEFPCVVPRWLLIPGTVYAVGQVNDALPAIKRLNELSRMELAAADLAVAGMWIAEDDGVLNPKTVKVGPRKVIVANSVDSMKPLLTGADFNVTFTIAEKLQASIRKILMADQLQPQDGPAMTAYEVSVRVGLIRQLLGPIYARLQAEYLKPLIDRCFGIAYRASEKMWAMGLPGVFTPPPESVAGREFTIRYISPLAMSQKMEQVGAMDGFEAQLITKSAAIPEELDIYNWEEADRKRAQWRGVPGELVRKPEEIRAIRDQREQMKQQSQMQQTVQPGLQSGIQEMGKAVGQKIVNG